MLAQSLSVGEAFAAMDALEVALKHFDGSPLLTCTKLGYQKFYKLSVIVVVDTRERRKLISSSYNLCPRLFVSCR
jgi:hypothetical protein